MRFILRRGGFFLLTLWAAVTLNFFLPRMMPGNPAIAMMGRFHGRVTGQGLIALENIFGVNTHASLPVQYLHYLGDVATGNFGTSLYFYPTSVSRVVLDAIPWTLGLVGVTTIRRAELVVSDRAIRLALEAAGVEFIDDNGGGGVRLRRPPGRKEG